MSDYHKVRNELEMAEFRRSAFRQVLDDVPRFKECRARYAREVEAAHAEKKVASKSGDFEAARFIDREVIRPCERMLKAFDIAKFILVDGKGVIPTFPFELLPELRVVEAEVGYL